MNTSLTHRLAAIVASVAVTSMLFSVVCAQATPPVTGSFLAQGATIAAR